MKHVYFTIASVLIANAVNSQVQVPDLNQPVGSVVDYRIFNIVEADSGTVGANQTWDYSAYGINGDTVRITYRLPDSNEAALYPGVNKVRTYSFGEDNFMKVDGDSSIVLAINDMYGSSYTFIDPYLLFEYPIDENYAISDYATFYDASSGFDYNFRRQAYYQGTGTLITPYGTFADALKLKIIDTLDLVAGGSLVTSVNTTTYCWINADNKSEIMMINREDNGVSVVLSGRFLKNGNALTVDENALIALDLYPNPASDFLQVTAEANTGNRFVILDVNGSIIQTGNLTENKTVDVRTLNAGGYFFRLYDGQTLKATASFVID